MTAQSPAVVKKLGHADKNDDWLIPDAYLYFYETFDDWLGPAGTEDFQRRLEVLYGTMREDLHVVVIDLEANDDAQEIFETLNSLGTPLLPADLVKNSLFHRAAHERENTRQLETRLTSIDHATRAAAEDGWRPARVDEPPHAPPFSAVRSAWRWQVHEEAPHPPASASGDSRRTS